MKPARDTIWLIAALALGACAVGPDFHEPEAPTVGAYTATPLPAETAGGPGAVVQRFATGRDVPDQWWTLFRSDPLDRLVRHALAQSPTAAAAQAALAQARENVLAEVGAISPHVDASVSASRQRFSPTAIGQPNAPSTVFNLYNASVQVSYIFDVAGGRAREIEALRAQADFQAFQTEAAYLALSGNIVTTAIREASLRAQLQATQDIAAAQQSVLGIIEQQFKLGGATRVDVLSQRTQLAQTRATLPALEKELAQTRHLLAVLAGEFPAEADLPAFTLDTIKLPEELPVSVPSMLVRQRPDIRAAEALWHQASAGVGVATANLYPRITLSASYGSQTNRTGELFDPSRGIWNVGASLLQPLFHNGELSARRRAALAAYDQAAAQYRDTVLRAFQNVADTLVALEADARTLTAQSEAATLARDTLDLTQKQFRLGGASYLALLNADRQYQQARIGMIQAQAQRYADTAALLQALGGGWWNRAAPIERASSPEGTTDR
ncbi:MAG: efflux transporter outer membrane subunit [Sulfurifustis sp.]